MMPEAPEPAPWPRGVAQALASEVEPKTMGRIVAAAQAKRWPILLGGPCGVGKSCLAALVASRIIGWRFIVLSDLLSAVATARTSDTRTAVMLTMTGREVERSEYEIMRWVEQAPILVVDDVGVRGLSEPQMDVLLRVVDMRYSKPTIFTTNCDAATLRHMVGDRVASRMTAGAKIWIDGVDRRQSRSGGPR